MRHKLVIGLLCSGLAACANSPPAPMIYPAPVISLAPPAPMQPVPLGDLATDRQACNAAHPPKIGNYLPHAECVNAAIERHALPSARYPDLVRLQERLRIRYSAQIDDGTITAETGEKNMGEADELIGNTIRERDAGRSEAANDRVASLQAVLQH